MRALGRHGPSVSDIGLGCMGMSDLYGAADDAESIATIHAALDAGVTLLDTGDYYGILRATRRPFCHTPLPFMPNRSASCGNRPAQPETREGCLAVAPPP